MQKVIDQTNIVKRYGGQWVVLDETRTRVLAADQNLRGAISKFQKKYARRAIPTTFKVPTEILPYVGTNA